MLTDAPWLTRNDPLQYMREGAQLGLEARGQDLSRMEAGQRLRLSFDSLANQQENQRRAAALDSQQLAATNALKAAQQDSMSLYRQQAIQDQQERLKQTADRTSQAADLLKASHDDTSKFVEDAESMGAAKALAKHPNADKTVVNHVMALESAKPPAQKGKIEFSLDGKPGINATRISTSLDDPLINSSLGTNAPAGTGTNYVSRLKEPAPAGPKVLDKTTASTFLKQAGGDKEKARQLARDAGFTF